MDQQQIVGRVYGQVVCATSSTIAIGEVLNSIWTDRFGQQFQANVTAAYDPTNGVSAIDNAFIINELTQNRPLLYANTHHCMVVVAADYFAAPIGPNVQRVGVLDPFPFNSSFHLLSQPEMIPAGLGGEMMFLAAVQI